MKGAYLGAPGAEASEVSSEEQWGEEGDVVELEEEDLSGGSSADGEAVGEDAMNEEDVIGEMSSDDEEQQQRSAQAIRELLASLSNK